VAGSGVLGMMITPSLLIIVYCLITEVSVGRMFLAAFLPGLLLTLMLCLGVMLMCWKWPAFSGRSHRDITPDHMTGGEIARAVVPLLLLILVTFGGIYTGVFTATEAGGVGALGAFVLALVEGKLNRRTLKRVLLETGASTSAICILIIAANLYSRLIALSDMPSVFSSWLAAADLSLAALMAAYVALLIFLGTFLDSISTVLLSVPLLLPTFAAAGADLVWVGIVTILAVEIGIVTPPLGISAFVVKGSLDDQRITLKDIYIGSYPFLGIMLMTLVLLVAFPSITLGILR
jgi:tripartite ATP-independent transporter DctM subunit